MDKYQKTAINFINKYPFAKFMTEEHIDYNTSLIKEGVKINAILIGFGKTNLQIFSSSVANNQFITEVDGKIGVKKVEYYVFDRDTSKGKRFLEQNYYRCKNFCKCEDQNDYLPFPDYPAEEYFYDLNVTDESFFCEIKKIISMPKSVNFVIIAFGSDAENVDFAQKLSKKCRESNVKNLNIFVKVENARNGLYSENERNFHVITTESEVENRNEDIINEPIYEMARMRNEIYYLEYELTLSDIKSLTQAKIAEIGKKARDKSYTLATPFNSESSLFGVLSIRSKLNLMGLDYCRLDENDKHALTEDEYFAVYAQDDQPDFDFYSVRVAGKPIIRYTLNFKNSRRKNLAFHEHLRWNAYMIAKGFVPATKRDILQSVDLNGKYTNCKDFVLLRHGNLTTFYGLELFSKMIAERDIKQYDSIAQAEENKDVIKYDYQLLDDAYWLLTCNGYKIVKLSEGDVFN